jgi:endoglycosylceramidase
MRGIRKVQVVAVVVVGALVLAACSGSDDDAGPDGDGTGGDGSGSSTSTSAPGDDGPMPALELLPLRAEGGDDPRFVDSEGREVLLRGVNVNALGEYYQADPDLPSTIPLTDADWTEMASLGFSSVRLIVSWSRLEPTPGAFDEEYVAQIHDAVDQARRNGIYVVLDMHQDAWGPHIATPDGYECPDGLEQAIGWDGAPEWATLTDGAETCRNPGSRESSLAVRTAFQSFYDDRDGIRTALTETWGRLAGEFADDPAVAGYDLFNEPNGVEQLENQLPKYTDFLTETIAAIRAAETEAGGFDHIVFVEPIVLYPLPNSIPVAGFSDDANLAFAPHHYWESITDILTIEDGFEITRRASAELGMPYWIGEYGWWSTDEADMAELRRYAIAEDAAIASGAWWGWRQACGDPHSIGVPGNEPDGQQHLHTLRCPGDEDLGITEEYAVVLSRTYPRSAPGRITELVSDPDERTARITGTTEGEDADASTQLVVWVPDSGHGEPTIGGSGLADVELTAGDRGWVVTATVGCEYVFEVDGAAEIASAPEPC